MYGHMSIKAERVGFEPTDSFSYQTISSRSLSTTQPPLRLFISMQIKKKKIMDYIIILIFNPTLRLA